MPVLILLLVLRLMHIDDYIYTANSCSAFLIVLKDSMATSSMELSGSRVVRDCKARFGLMRKRTKGESK